MLELIACVISLAFFLACFLGERNPLLSKTIRVVFLCFFVPFALICGIYLAVMLCIKIGHETQNRQMLDDVENGITSPKVLRQN